MLSHNRHQTDTKSCLIIFPDAKLALGPQHQIILVRSETFEIVKIRGAGYLVFLGAVSIWKARPSRLRTSRLRTLPPRVGEIKDRGQQEKDEGLIYSDLALPNLL